MCESGLAAVTRRVFEQRGSLFAGGRLAVRLSCDCVSMRDGLRGP